MISQFFENTFKLPAKAALELDSSSSPLGLICEEGLAKWQKDTEDFIENTFALPLSLWYHPRLIAAAYLYFILQNEKEKNTPLKVPE